MSKRAVRPVLMQAYQLKPHVRACRDGATLVFLDLRQDRYRSVPARSAPYILEITDGADGASGQATRLLDLGLIEPATKESSSRAARRRAPEQKLVSSSEVNASVRDMVVFANACLGAGRSLSMRRLDLTLAALERRKAHVRAPHADKERLVASFETFRPWYPRSRVCLFDSLALMLFMLARGVAPDLVLGVRASPFAAHCWLELDGMLVCDTSDHCASFTPIAWV